MELAAAIRTRFSERRLVDPAPDDRELRRLVEWAANAPDHGRLRPWRLITVRGSARDALGEAFAFDSDVASTERLAQLPRRAPLLVTIVFRPQPRERVPRWEQMAATIGVISYLQLLLHDRGYGSIWRTGDHTRCATARVILDLRGDESLLGWLYVGTPDPQAVLPRRPAAPSAAELVSAFQPARCLGELRSRR